MSVKMGMVRKFFGILIVILLNREWIDRVISVTVEN